MTRMLAVLLTRLCKMHAAGSDLEMETDDYSKVLEPSETDGHRHTNVHVIRSLISLSSHPCFMLLAQGTSFEQINPGDLWYAFSVPALIRSSTLLLVEGNGQLQQTRVAVAMTKHVRRDEACILPASNPHHQCPYSSLYCSRH